MQCLACYRDKRGIITHCRLSSNGVEKVFPKDERFRLCDQLGRAVISIPSNIAEGNGRESKAEYARFLGSARGSLYETETQLEIAKRLGYVDDLSEVSGLISEIARMLISIIAKLRV